MRGELVFIFESSAFLKKASSIVILLSQSVVNKRLIKSAQEPDK